MLEPFHCTKKCDFDWNYLEKLMERIWNNFKMMDILEIGIKHYGDIL